MRLLCMNPDHPPAYNNLGIALLNQRRIDEAVAAYRRALELDPAHSGAHGNLLFALNHDPRGELEQVFAEHKSWAAAPAGAVGIRRMDFPSTRDAGRRLRRGDS